MSSVVLELDDVPGFERSAKSQIRRVGCHRPPWARAKSLGYRSTRSVEHEAHFSGLGSQAELPEGGGLPSVDFVDVAKRRLRPLVARHRHDLPHIGSAVGEFGGDASLS